MKKILLYLITFTVATSLLCACTNREVGTVGGAAIGGLAGNALTGGSTGGTIVGAVGGGLIGNAISR